MASARRLSGCGVKRVRIVRASAGREPMYNDKCDDDLKLHLPSRLKSRLREIAKKNDRDLSDYCRHVLTRHVIVATALENEEGSRRVS